MFSKILLRLHGNKLYFNDIRHLRRGRYEVAKPEIDLQERVLKVAVIGLPNAGKSTFINNLMDRKVCASSSKVHTTRRKASAIITQADTQIVFLDTPGLIGIREFKKFNLERSFIKDSKSTLYEADIIGVIHDVSNMHLRDRIDLKVIRLLEENHKKPSFLVLNKIDMLKSKRKLLDVTRLLTDNSLKGKPIDEIQNDPHGDRAWPNFEEVFMVSALENNGLEDVKNYLMAQSKPGKWIYPANVWSDQAPEDIVVNTVKATFLDFLQQELPYQLKPELELFNINNEGVINTVVLVQCPSDRIAKLIAGDNNGRLRMIIERVQGDLQNAFHNYVRLNIVLQTRNK